MTRNTALENRSEELEKYLRNKRSDEYGERIRRYLRNKRYERAEANYRILKHTCEKLRGKLYDLLRLRDRTYDEKEEEIKELGTMLRRLEGKLDRAAEHLREEEKRKQNL